MWECRSASGSRDSLSAEDVRDSIEEAETFCADLLDFMERLHQGDISRLREEALRLLEGPDE